MKCLLHCLAIVAVFSSVAVTLALPQPSQAAVPSCVHTYLVRRGDTLFRIGLRFGIQFTVLQRLNGLPNPNRIFAGERLCVRRSGTMSAGGVAPTAAASGMSMITVIAKDFEFVPKTITITAGSSLIFSNQGAQNHTATADDRSFDTQIIAPGTSSQPIKFDKAGTFRFYCQFHGKPGGIGMSGVVIVK